MKIKTDFVTNSSTSSYILSYTEKENFGLENLLRKIFKVKKRQIKVLAYIETIEHLEKHHKGKPFDWIEKIVGYNGFGEIGSPALFDAAKEAISKGNKIIHLEMDRDVNLMEILKGIDELKIIGSESH